MVKLPVTLVLVLSEKTVKPRWQLFRTDEISPDGLALTMAGTVE